MAVFFARVFLWPAWLFTWTFFPFNFFFFCFIFKYFWLSTSCCLSLFVCVVYDLGKAIDIYQYPLAAVRLRESVEKNGCNWFDQLFNLTNYSLLPMSLLVSVCISLLECDTERLFVVVVAAAECAFILAPLSQTNENLSFFFCFNRFNFSFAFFSFHASSVVSKRDQLYNLYTKRNTYCIRIRHDCANNAYFNSCFCFAFRRLVSLQLISLLVFSFISLYMQLTLNMFFRLYFECALFFSLLFASSILITSEYELH